MPQLDGIVETALYVEDLERSVKFYQQLFGLETLGSDQRFHAFSVAAHHVLLLFRKGGSNQPMELPGGVIPPHNGGGTIHIGFSISPETVSEWEAKLASNGVAIESKMSWPRGGLSLYFRDPDGHLLELLTPGVWTIY